MKNFIIGIFLILISSCGRIQNLAKNTSKSKLDSTYSNVTDSAITTSNNGVKDSTAVSNWQKETVIEYYTDWNNNAFDSSSYIIEKGTDTILVPKSSSIKKITIRENGKDSTRLIITNKNLGTSKVSKTGTGETKKVATSNVVNKVVTKKPIWPYVLVLVMLLIIGIYLYIKKISPFTLLSNIVKHYE